MKSNNPDNHDFKSIFWFSFFSFFSRLQSRIFLPHLKFKFSFESHYYICNDCWKDHKYNNLIISLSNNKQYPRLILIPRVWRLISMYLYFHIVIKRRFSRVRLSSCVERKISETLDKISVLTPLLKTVFYHRSLAARLASLCSTSCL